MSELSEHDIRGLQRDIKRADLELTNPPPFKQEETLLEKKKRILNPPPKLEVGKLEGIIPEPPDPPLTPLRPGRLEPGGEETEYYFGEDAMIIAREAGLDITDKDDRTHLLTLVSLAGDF